MLGWRLGSMPMLIGEGERITSVAYSIFEQVRLIALREFGKLDGIRRRRRRSTKVGTASSLFSHLCEMQQLSSLFSHCHRRRNTLLQYMLPCTHKKFQCSFGILDLTWSKSSFR